jgi:hypothetical protein
VLLDGGALIPAKLDEIKASEPILELLRRRGVPV